MPVTVGPTVNLANVAEVREAILDALHADDACALDCSSLTDVDLTFLQLLTSTFKLGDRLGKSITLPQTAAPAVAALMERAGFGSPEDWPEVWSRIGQRKNEANGQ